MIRHDGLYPDLPVVVELGWQEAKDLGLKDLVTLGTLMEWCLERHGPHGDRWRVYTGTDGFWAWFEDEASARAFAERWCSPAG